MTRRFVTTPRAERNLIEHFAFIARDKLDPAERFLEVAEETFQQLAEMPGMGSIWRSSQPHLAGIRMYPMPSGFRNYLIFYRTIDQGVEILTILHGARDIGAILSEMRF